MDNASLLDTKKNETISQNDELKKQKEEQRKLIEKLICRFDFKDWMNDFSCFEEKYKRFLYSDISALIIAEYDDDRASLLISNISSVTERIRVDLEIQKDRKIEETDFIGETVNISSEKYSLIYKLYDHCNLANIQKNAYTQTGKSIRENVYHSFSEKYKEEYDEKIKPKIDLIQKDLTGQLIGIVAIFTALAFLISGGTAMFDSILGNIRLASVSRMICAGIIWTLCMSVLFYIFALLILKIVKVEKNEIFSKSFEKIFWIYMTL